MGQKGGAAQKVHMITATGGMPVIVFFGAGNTGKKAGKIMYTRKNPLKKKKQ